MEGRKLLGEAFISGRIINLDKASIEDLKHFKTENMNERSNIFNSVDSLIEEIRNK